MLYLLALAVFAMGTSEFMLAGLLPDIATDLHVTVGAAGTLTSAFAVGMVVGAPLVAAFARKLPRRACLLGFLLAFAAAHLVGAVTTSFPLLLATRVLAALANAGFLAIALTTATALVPADAKGRALAVLLAGTTIATVAGVPGGALLGVAAGWRATFWAVAVLCLPAAFGLLRSIPRGSDDGPPLRTELAALRRRSLVRAMSRAALVNAATFGGFTYLAPATGLDGLWVPVALMLFGAGSFVGVTLAGRWSDRQPRKVLVVGGPLLLLGWPALALATGRIALLGLVFVLGAASFAVGSTLIARVLYTAADAPTMAGSYATAALNVGAVAGPLVAAATLHPSPFWASAVLVAVGLVF
ncbi:Cmx/CmrA family chloramphenicol efflux MFS transporter [Labedaea rhizosphaerae]|uniref:DHA1 family chloramphenicol resistance protein-like MFS transporter n=1 Tax=Labedaea rhizosphaerae TaxID=598644 RepID=A0A4R6SB81_LABRH|nr:Cmx/CmrA family chloramphenicol efflux MFS transporter [Labedaea rhizosphaerae]TDP97161.1 DHA1 family chloramphenicol resistance protein-like MFS transporter [Labedaea rhizosphaerae]